MKHQCCLWMSWVRRRRHQERRIWATSTIASCASKLTTDKRRKNRRRGYYDDDDDDDDYRTRLASSISLALCLCLFGRNEQKNSWGISRIVQQGPFVRFPAIFLSFSLSIFAEDRVIDMMNDIFIIWQCLAMLWLSAFLPNYLARLFTVLALAVLRLIMIIFTVLLILFVAWWMLSFWWIEKEIFVLLSLANHFFRDMINNIKITRNIIHSNEFDDTWRRHGALAFIFGLLSIYRPLAESRWPEIHFSFSNKELYVSASRVCRNDNDRKEWHDLFDILRTQISTFHCAPQTKGNSQWLRALLISEDN